MTKITLSPMERDFATEVFNIGLNHAANSLSQLVGQDVDIDIPALTLLKASDFKSNINQSDACAVTQTINGLFNARALVLFDEIGSLEIIRLMLGDELSNETIIEIRPDALMEIGNIILNSCIGVIGNWVKGDFEVGLPEFITEIENNFFKVMSVDADDIVLGIGVNIKLPEHKTSGTIAFLLGPISFASLRQFLQDNMPEDEGLAAT